MVGRLTKGLVSLAKQRKVTTLQGVGKFESPNLIAVETADGIKHGFLRYLHHRGGLARGAGFPASPTRTRA